MTGGSVDGYKKVLAVYLSDIELRLPQLQNNPQSDDLPQFITNVHAIKSASASIGAATIATAAARLERLGRAGNLPVIRETLSGFVERLTELAQSIGALLSAQKEGDAGSGEDALADPLEGSIILELASALSGERAGEIERILSELKQKKTDPKTREVLDKVSDCVLLSEFEEAAGLVTGLLQGKS
jgi:HPt (histidine-containing phosphotransfer) domain-containing protein